MGISVMGVPGRALQHVDLPASIPIASMARI
jgi:hypothetical protein